MATRKTAPGKTGARKPAAKKEFGPIFTALRDILKTHARQLVVTTDEPKNYYLDTKNTGPNKKPLFFGAVRQGKNYVSYYLMPVYVFPDLLTDISSELKTRMQGKSCFNFKAADTELFRELAKLTREGISRFKKAGMI
jgi:hypothetical protein